jgi:hypothetical protein
MLAQLREQGVEITKVFDPEPNGKFAHVMAPGGIKIELWEPVSPDPYDPGKRGRELRPVRRR